MFENRVLMRLFGLKRDEVTGKWGKLHNDELSDLYPLPNNVWVVKSRRKRSAGHVAPLLEMKEGCTRLWWGSLRKGGHWETQT